MYNSTPIDQVDLLNLPSNKKSFISENEEKNGSNNEKGQPFDEWEISESNASLWLLC